MTSDVIIWVVTGAALLVLFAVIPRKARWHRYSMFLLFFWLLTEPLWIPAKHFEGIAVDVDGNILVASCVANRFGILGGHHIEVSRFDDSGRLRDTVSLKLPKRGYYDVNALLSDSDGNVLLALSPETEKGPLLVKLSRDGRELWSAEPSGRVHDMRVLDSAVVCLGKAPHNPLVRETFGLDDGAPRNRTAYDSITPHGWPEIPAVIGPSGDLAVYADGPHGTSLVKADTAGHPVWELPVANPGFWVLQNDQAGSLYLAGRNGSSAGVSKYDSEGKEDWSTSFGIGAGEESSTVQAVAFDDSNAVYVYGVYTVHTGRTAGVIRRSEAFMAKLSPSGRVEWRKPLEKFERLDTRRAMAVDPWGNSYVAVSSGEGSGCTLLRFTTSGAALWRSSEPAYKLMVLPLWVIALALELVRDRHDKKRLAH